MALGGAITMKQVFHARRNYSPQEVQNQEPYYWIVSLYAGDPNGFGVMVGCYRDLVSKKEERALELAAKWLNEGRILSDDRELFVRIEQVAVTSSVVYVK